MQYHNLLEVALAVQEKFAGETALNRIGVGKGCVYAPRHNNVGCAIGCLLPLDLATRMDVEGGCSVIYFYNSSWKAHDAIRDELAALFPDISPYDLNKLQVMHDRADDVEDFMRQLAAYIQEHSVTLPAQVAVKW